MYINTLELKMYKNPLELKMSVVKKIVPCVDFF